MDRLTLSKFFGLIVLTAVFSLAPQARAAQDDRLNEKDDPVNNITKIPDPGDTLTRHDWEPSDRANTKMQEEVGVMTRSQPHTGPNYLSDTSGGSSTLNYSPQINMQQSMNEQEVTGADSSPMRGRSIKNYEESVTPGTATQEQQQAGTANRGVTMAETMDEDQVTGSETSPMRGKSIHERDQEQAGTAGDRPGETGYPQDITVNQPKPSTNFDTLKK